MQKTEGEASTVQFLIACSMQKNGGGAPTVQFCSLQKRRGKHIKNWTVGRLGNEAIPGARNGPRGILYKRPPPSYEQNSGRRLLKRKANRYLVPVHTQYDIFDQKVSSVCNKTRYVAAQCEYSFDQAGRVQQVAAIRYCNLFPLKILQWAFIILAVAAPGDTM